MSNQRTATNTAVPLLPERDQEVVRLVGKLKQMTTAQVRASVFAELASAAPVDRALKRLVELRYLSRLERRLVGGSHGGSSQHVYQLGRQGWRLLDRPGVYWAPRAVNLHTLAIADCYVALRQAEGRGELEVIDFITEPACHQAIGPVLLTPDAYVEVGNRREGWKRALWLEIDRGTEHRYTIGEKCSRYWKALHQWREEFFPTVLFVAPDNRRAQQLAQMAHGGPDDSQVLFKVATMEDFAAACIGTDGGGEVAAGGH